MKKCLFLLFALIPVSAFAQTSGWELVNSGKAYVEMYRLAIPHGWLVRTENYYNMQTIFVPDENHDWK